MWIEELRPQKFDEIIGQEHIVQRLRAFLENPKEMPHLLFAGPPGVGKTTSAHVMGHELFGEEYFADNFKEMNSSEERKLEHIRNIVKKYVQFQPSGDFSFRILVMDEADALPRDSQSALRRIMEKSSKNIRFILIVNYANEIISPILSRCAILHFLPLNPEDIRQNVQTIAKSNDLNIPEEAINALVDISGGDMRKAINYMQSLSILKHEISFEDVYEIAGLASPNQIEKIVKDLIQKKKDYSIDNAYSDVKNLIFFDGFQGKDLIKQFNKAVQQADYISTEDKLKFNSQVGDAEFRITQGSNELVQLTSILAVISGIPS